MTSSVPRILIAGTNSGCGKTTVCCALLQALVNRRLKVGAFKCGPDYIDPMFHSKVIGAKSRNLDLFFFSNNTLRYLLSKNSIDCDLSILEGVMGYYDGMGVSSTKASTYEVARTSDTPTVLVVNAKGASLSVIAVIEGFLNFRSDSNICGVILNQCSEMTYQTLKKAIEGRFNGKVIPLGFMPKMSEAELESRHLGLITADEVKNLKYKLNLLAEQAEKTIDIDGLLNIASQASDLDYEEILLPRFEEPVRIAVARDEAFCFYYEDSLQALREMGADIVEFSPVRDASLPKGVHGLYLGGGYPELYAEKLSVNKSMLASIKEAIKNKLPCIAECGGFMYLTERIDEKTMVGAIMGDCRNTGKLTRFGYVTLSAKYDNMLCKKDEEIRAHEFHYYDADVTGNNFEAKKSTGRRWDAVIANDHLYAGYPHFHFYANPIFAENFYKACLEVKNNV